MTSDVKYCTGCNRMVRDIEVKLCSQLQYCVMKPKTIIDEEVISEKEFLSEHDTELKE